MLQQISSYVVHIKDYLSITHQAVFQSLVHIWKYQLVPIQYLV